MYMRLSSRGLDSGKAFPETTGGNSMHLLLDLGPENQAAHPMNCPPFTSMTCPVT